jgi:hypothetical protein
MFLRERIESLSSNMSPIEVSQTPIGSDSGVTVLCPNDVRRYLPKGVQDRKEMPLFLRIRHWIEIALPFFLGHVDLLHSSTLARCQITR